MPCLYLDYIPTTLIQIIPPTLGDPTPDLPGTTNTWVWDARQTDPDGINQSGQIYDYTEFSPYSGQYIVKVGVILPAGEWNQTASFGTGVYENQTIFMGYSQSSNWYQEEPNGFAKGGFTDGRFGSSGDAVPATLAQSYYIQPNMVMDDADGTPGGTMVTCVENVTVVVTKQAAEQEIIVHLSRPFKIQAEAGKNLIWVWRNESGYRPLADTGGFEDENFPVTLIPDYPQAIQWHQIKDPGDVGWAPENKAHMSQIGDRPLIKFYVSPNGNIPVSIGTGQNNTLDTPFAVDNTDSLSSTIYLASELTAMSGKTIIGIEWDFINWGTYAEDYTMNNQKLILQHTTETYFPNDATASTYSSPAGSFTTVVANHTVTWKDTDAVLKVKIEFDQGFVYNGTSNLYVTLENKTTSSYAASRRLSGNALTTNSGVSGLDASHRFYHWSDPSDDLFVDNYRQNELPNVRFYYQD